MLTRITAMAAERSGIITESRLFVGTYWSLRISGSTPQHSRDRPDRPGTIIRGELRKVCGARFAAGPARGASCNQMGT